MQNHQHATHAHRQAAIHHSSAALMQGCLHASMLLLAQQALCNARSAIGIA